MNKIISVILIRNKVQPNKTTKQYKKKPLGANVGPVLRSWRWVGRWVEDHTPAVVLPLPSDTFIVGFVTARKLRKLPLELA